MNTKRIPGFVGPPEQPPQDPLTDEMRACLLRAARKQLDHLQNEVQRLQDLPIVYAHGPIAVVQAELSCLARAVCWLWRLQLET